MTPPRLAPSARFALRVLAATSVLLALICAALAVAWSREHEAAGCWREALRQNETWAVAEADCL